MPHHCTGCGYEFADGSKEMLTGCPECGGNKFQFRPANEQSADSSNNSETTTSKSQTPPEPSGSSVAKTVGRATTKVRDFVSQTEPHWAQDTSASPDPNAAWPDESKSSQTESSSGSDIIDADARRTETSAVEEDHAQAHARSEVVTNEELSISSGGSSSDGPPASDGRVVREPTEPDEDVDMEDLREQLNDQFESIKIVEPGQYELNLMELYDREEYIIALQENGRYMIQVPEQWIGEELGTTD